MRDIFRSLVYSKQKKWKRNEKSLKTSFICDCLFVIKLIFHTKSFIPHSQYRSVGSVVSTAMMRTSFRSLMRWFDYLPSRAILNPLLTLRLTAAATLRDRRLRNVWAKARGKNLQENRSEEYLKAAPDHLLFLLNETIFETPWLKDHNTLAYELVN